MTGGWGCPPILKQRSFPSPIACGANKYYYYEKRNQAQRWTQMDAPGTSEKAERGGDRYVVKSEGVSDRDTAQYRVLMLRAQGISKRFGAVEALKSIDFEIP